MTRKSPISIRDVAARAGVSLSTVSQSLNDNKAARISEATRERVRVAATELGYQPNRLARSLIRGKTQTIGLMFSGLRNPVFISMLESCERLVMDAGYQPMLDTAPSKAGTYQTHAVLNSWPVDGIILWAMSHQRVDEFIRNLRPGLPVVYIGGYDGTEADVVRLNHRSGTREAAQYVFDRGFRKVAFAAPYPDFVDDRHEEVMNFFQSKGMPLQRLDLPGAEETLFAGRALGLQIAEQKPEDRPEAILCHNDVIAIGLIHGLHRAGVRVPEDIAVVGFDGTDEGQALPRPLTTVKIPVEEMCQRACEFLFQRLEDPSLPVQSAVIDTKLMVGETT